MISFGATLLSGGLDSTTVTACAKDQVQHLTAITFQYGQRHIKEVECAKHIVRLMQIEHKLIDVSFLREVAWYSALTNPGMFATLDHGVTQEVGSGIPITYVPLRNTIFLALSAGFLESQVLHAIEVQGLRPEDVSARLYMAPNAVDYSGYPDCRPEYFEQVRRTLEYGSKLWTKYNVKITVETPIIELSKAEIIQLAVRLKVPIEHTWSCYDGGVSPCGRCDSCIFRAKGFDQAGILDPLMDGPRKV